MARGPLYEEDYKPTFSGHETFPVRYGWLKKAYDAVAETEGSLLDNRWVFLQEDAIARFGVGKNMVSSMRHWASATRIITEDEETKRFQTTELGSLLFKEKGLDPYMEHPSTLWLIHWQLAGTPDKTTWYWAFNHFASPYFEREQLFEGLKRLSATREWSRVSESTIKRDVDCFIRTYVSKGNAERSAYEDSLESPLVELSLIRPVGKRDGFQFARGEKSSLKDGVFAKALVEFWQNTTSARTLSFEALAHEPGSPGRVFLLDESSLADRLMRLEDYTLGCLKWSETAGLKQVIIAQVPTDKEISRWIYKDYTDSPMGEVA